MKNRPITEKIYEELCEVIPGGVNSPVRACKGMGQLPMVVASGNKDLITDVDGNQYIDFCCSWGAIVHGHAHPQIVDAVQKRVALGTSFGITTQVEATIAKKIVQHVPSIEKIRFVSSGTEATMSAARLARGYTNRDLIIKFSGNYHGHADHFLVQAGSGVLGLQRSSSAGIPDPLIAHTISLPFNDLQAFQNIMDDPNVCERLAAVIVEPVAGNMGVIPAKPEFLTLLRSETRRIGALLIFDEVITGFRVGLGGAQEKYKIKPDLTCLGKIIGGGFPAAAFGGRQEIMDLLAPLGSVYQAGTLSGNPVAMEAGLQALLLVEKRGFYEDLERKTKLLTEPLKEQINRLGINACVQEVGSMFTLFFGKKVVNHLEDARGLDQERYAQLFRFMFENGVYLPPMQQEAWFISSAHTEEHLAKTLELLLDFLNKS